MDEVWICGRVATHQLSSMQDCIVRRSTALAHVEHGKARPTTVAGGLDG